jgi:hypothetical protein
MIRSTNKVREEIQIKYSQEKGKKEANLKGKSEIQQTIILLSRIQIQLHKLHSNSPKLNTEAPNSINSESKTYLL